MGNLTYIYVMGREEGPVKVGITSNPRSRLSVVQTGCPFRIGLFHAVAVPDRGLAIQHERNFHGVYAENRLTGEWFDLGAYLAIEGVDTTIEIDAAFTDMEAHGGLWPWERA